MSEPGHPIELRLIGPMALSLDGAAQPLPASRKTRALLGYLAMAGRPVHRDLLCELFWDIPDDPRGSLRWSLSKLRSLLDHRATEWLKADRDSVELALPDAAVDWHRLRALVRGGVADAATADLERAAACRGELLQGLDLPRADRYQAWCVAHREDVRQWHAAVLAELSGRDVATEAALGHARAWVEIDGDAPAAWARLVELLDRAGRAPESAEQRSIGIRRLGAAGRPVPAALRQAPPPHPGAPPDPDIRFCTSADGTGLAYALAGKGPPIVKIANWMTHLELDAQGPIWRHWISEFSRDRRLLRYDQRGNGLSDWRTSFSFDAYVADLEAVADAAGLDRFDLLGISQGASVAVAYAVRHPERVRKLVLLGGFARGWVGGGEEAARRQAMITLTREGWGLDNPAFRQMFTSLFLPDGTPEAHRWFNDLQRVATSAENACAIQLANGETDVRALLAKVAAPTLVAHCRDDAMVPFEAGRTIARAIPGARFLALEGRNHILLESDPGWPRFVAAVRTFLDEPA
jgi:pimeloyl-ACP methyl ester carboxylesterase/DNA-binding SARP family transcriptional activator